MSDLDEKPDIKPRLGLCEVCDENPAKYTCPACEVKTCSLPCSKIHKQELDCDGVRNKVKYKPLRAMGDMDLQSDYHLLEQASRDFETYSKKIRETGFISRSERERCNKLIDGASKRKIRLQLLPVKFSKHRINKTYLDWKKDQLFWTIEWVFPEAENFNCYDPRIPEDEILMETISKYTDCDKSSDELKRKLKIYQKGDKEIKILMKAEKLPGEKFFLVNPKKTLNENLMHKIIVEYPVMFVIFEENLKNYNFVHLVPKKSLNKNLLMNTDDGDNSE